MVLYISLETVHVNGTMVLVSMLQVSWWDGWLFPVGRWQTNPFLQLHESGHVRRDVLWFDPCWWRLETTIVLLTVWQSRVSCGLRFTNKRDLMCKNRERHILEIV